MSELLEIDEELLATARDLAARRDVPLITVVNELIRTALRPTVVFDPELGLPVFSVPEGSPPIDLVKLQAALDESI